MKNFIDSTEFTEYWNCLINDYKKSVGNIPPAWESHLRYTFCAGAVALLEIRAKFHEMNLDKESIKLSMDKIIDEINMLSK